MLETSISSLAICLVKRVKFSGKNEGRTHLVEPAILKKVFSSLAILLIVDFAAGMSVPLFHGIGVFLEKTGVEVASDFAFVEGAAILFAGSLMAFFSQGFRVREKILMIIGAAMIGISVAFNTIA
jgi:hypothetical protein